MGLNIAGLVISNNDNKDLSELADDVKLKLEISNEINYETASSNWIPEEEFRLYFSESATILFFNHEEADNSYHSRIHNCMSFSYSATAMIFSIEYFESGELVRSIWEVERERKANYGKFLPEEKENLTADALTFALINRIMGEVFTRIPGENLAYNCKKTLRLKN